MPPCTLHTAVGHEGEPIKGSRFIVRLLPIADAEDAGMQVDLLRAEFADARHHCWAWRCGPPLRERSSDDGEPSGSAGRPILAQLQHKDLWQVLAVVIRYFGGIKLGVGGLVRAYGRATAAAIAGAELVPLIEMARLRLTFGYELTRPVETILHGWGLQLEELEYGARVTGSLTLPLADAARLQSELNEACGGRLLWET